MTKYRINSEKNGIEVIFDSKPAADIITALKNEGVKKDDIR